MIAVPGRRLAARGVARVLYRTRQGLTHLRPGADPSVDIALRRLLPPELHALVRRLPYPDRRHLLRAGQRAAALSADPDLRLAALLHDVGKADERAVVRLPQRVLLVLLGASAPGLLRRLARPSRPRWRHALYLGLEHPRLGARLATERGASDRAGWLIAHHHDRPATDDDLALLERIDEEA